MHDSELLLKISQLMDSRFNHIEIKLNLLEEKIEKNILLQNANYETLNQTLYSTNSNTENPHDLFRLQRDIKNLENQISILRIQQIQLNEKMKQ